MSDKTLISAFHLRKYFPIKSTGTFLNRKKEFVRANKDINLNIIEGETLGIVGESGCGKSTFGRTIIQLHQQTGGATLYYGQRPEVFKPEYLEEGTKNLAKHHDGLLKAKDSQPKHLNKFLLVSPHRGILRFYGGILAHHDLGSVSRRLMKAWHQDSESFREMVAVVKEEASKSTMFSFFEQYQDDSIDLSLLTQREMRRLRKDLQIIFQDPYSSLDPRLTVKQLIGDGLITNKVFASYNDPDIDEYIFDVMEKCGLDRAFADRYPHQFSGGQRQRIGIARAVALQPKFIVCDEAVSALDVSIQSQIINLLQELKEKENMTYLFITHDLGVVRYISDRIGVMFFGNLVELAPADEIFSNPLHPYTKELLRAIPRLEGEELHFEYRTDLAIDFPFTESRMPGKDWVEATPGHFVACRLLEDEQGGMSS